MPEFQPRGRELTLPQPWPGIGLNWYDDSRERAPTSPAAEAAARADLLETLREQPGVYWFRGTAERQLNETFKLRSVGLARTLLANASGAVLIDARRIWCSEAVADAWGDVKRKVYAALPTDQLATLDELKAVVDVDGTSLHAALAVLIEDRVVEAIQDDPAIGPFYIRSRGVNADYGAEYAKRVALRRWQ